MTRFTPHFPRETRLHILAALFYALLGFVILHAILFNTNAQVAGYDWFNYNWNYWWIRQVSTTPGLSVFQSNFVFAPQMNNFGYHALTAFWYPLWALTEPLVGTLAAVNIILFVGCWLNGFVLFALLRREGAAPLLALLGGAALQFSPVTRYFYYNTHLNLMDWFWLPAHILFWSQIARAVRANRMPQALFWAVIHGLAIWGLGLTDLQFPIFVAFWLVPYGLWTLWAIGSWPARLRLVLSGLLAVSVGGALLWIAGPLPYVLRFQGALAPGLAEDRPGIPFPRGYFSLDAVWWWWDTPTLGGSVMILLLITLIVWGIRRRNISDRRPQPQSLQTPRWFWFVVLLPPLILSMGPTIHILGFAIPMPFRLLHQLTNGMFRMPWRLAPIFVGASMVFIAKLWTPILQKRRMVLLGTGVVVLVWMALDVRLFETAPLKPVFPPYAFYSEIGQEQGSQYDNLVLLEVPTGAATGEVILGDPQATQLQWYGIAHQKRMLNGFISRAPIDDFWRINTDDALLAWLGQRRYLEPDTVAAQLQEYISNWPLGYIVVHQDMIGRSTTTPQEIIGYLNTLPALVCPYRVERDAVLYRTSAHPDGCPPRTPSPDADGSYTIDVGSSGDERYIGWGWHWSEQVAGLALRWMGEYPQTNLYVDLPPADYDVSVSAQAFWEPRQMQIRVNGQPIGQPVTVQPDTLQTFTFHLPAALVGDGQHLTVTFDYDRVIVPNEVGQSADPRKLSLAVDWVRFSQP